MFILNVKPTLRKPIKMSFRTTSGSALRPNRSRLVAKVEVTTLWQWHSLRPSHNTKQSWLRYDTINKEINAKKDRYHLWFILEVLKSKTILKHWPPAARTFDNTSIRIRRILFFYDFSYPTNIITTIREELSETERSALTWQNVVVSMWWPGISHGVSLLY